VCLPALAGRSARLNRHPRAGEGSLLRAAPAGRAIFVTLGVARGVFPYWGPYALSKAGLEMLVEIYAGEIGKTRVRANPLDPGIVRTRLRARAFPGEDPNRLPPPDSAADAFLALALPRMHPQRRGRHGRRRFVVTE
jgi:NAD(P)-dependent dehydrogenase (short-subunit alcohol dehydrogenase family)